MVWMLVFSLLACGCGLPGDPAVPETTTPAATTEPTQAPTVVVTDPPHIWVTGYISTLDLETPYVDEEGNLLGTLLRGTPVEYEMTPEGRISILLDSAIVYLPEDTVIVEDAAVGNVPCPPPFLYFNTISSVLQSIPPA